jgi:Nif-specific regulatory protein
MERTAILSSGEVMDRGDLPAHIAAGIVVGAAPSLPTEQGLAEVERVHILQTLERVGWNHSRAAEVLRIGRTTLWRKLKEYGLTR